MGRPTVSTEEIVRAYQETGSVWAAGKRVGLAGQTVWERLRMIGYPMRHQRWTEAEYAELERLVTDHTLTQIAHALGRPYGAVATKISDRGLAGRGPHHRRGSLPRGAGYDKATTLRRVRELEAFSGTVRQFARMHGIHLDPFIKAIQRHAPEFWECYVREHSDLPAAECAYCGGAFYPLTKKQKTCSRRCQAHLRSDRSYFGGKRRTAIGMAEGICQLCLEQKESLSAHHVFGKENDPDNDYLVALCAGCHQLVSHLAGRKFIENAEGWENLINLALLRRFGDRQRHQFAGVHTYVDIELLGKEDVLAESDQLRGEPSGSAPAQLPIVEPERGAAA